VRNPPNARMAKVLDTRNNTDPWKSGRQTTRSYCSAPTGARTPARSRPSQSRAGRRLRCSDVLG
jgi:hypothetical protein